MSPGIAALIHPHSIAELGGHATHATTNALSLEFPFSAPTWIDVLRAVVRGRSTGRRCALALAALIGSGGCRAAGGSPQDDGAGGSTGSTEDDGGGPSSDGTGACADGCDAAQSTGSGGAADSTDTGAVAALTVRIATWNVLRVGRVGSEQYEALAAIVQRLDADVLCVQEVGEGEESPLQALSQAGGYDNGLLTPVSGPPGSGIANACMSRLPTIDAVYLWSDWISSDPSARDLTRPFVRLRLDHRASGRTVSVLSGHLKAGGDDVDRFRRMVESIRLGQATLDERAIDRDAVVVVLGDFNERPNPRATTFATLPAGLPGSYNLGRDIDFPITYDPGAPLSDAGLTRVEARWEDGAEQTTFIPFESRLDYVYVLGGDVLAAEVYEACRDDGVDDVPTGDVLDKAGTPLRCGTSEQASDHRPVVVDIRID